MDNVILVNEQDQEMGVMDKVEAHRGLGKLHRAISVFLFNREGKLLAQQRSDKKIVGAGQWANTCCGNVRPGEDYLACAYRRLREEIGIKPDSVSLKEVCTFRYMVQCNTEFSENEMDHIFIARFDGDLVLNPDEVAQCAWMEMDRLKTQTNLAPWVRMMDEKGIFTIIEDMYGKF